MDVTRAPAGRRRSSYLAGAVLDAALLLLISVAPGWRAVPFLTGETPRVLGWVVLALAAALLGNLIHLWRDPPALVAVNHLVATALALLAAVRVWQVFPFDFADAAFPWATIVRAVLGLVIAGEIVGLVAFAATLALHRTGR